MVVRLEIDVDVAHQLGQLRRRPILSDHLGADANNPQQLGMRSVAEVHGLDAGGAFHRAVFAVDRVDVRQKLLLGRDRRGRDQKQAHHNALCHRRKNSTCASAAPIVSTSASHADGVREGTNIWCHSSVAAKSAARITAAALHRASHPARLPRNARNSSAPRIPYSARWAPYRTRARRDMAGEYSRARCEKTLRITARLV